MTSNTIGNNLNPKKTEWENPEQQNALPGICEISLREFVSAQQPQIPYAEKLCRNEVGNETE